MDVTTFFVTVEVYLNDTLAHTFTDVPKNKVSNLVTPWATHYGPSKIKMKTIDSENQTRLITFE